MNKKEIIIFFALKQEANELLSNSKLQISKTANNEYSAKVNGFQIRIIITGVGKKNIEKYIIEKNIGDPLLIIKAGTCAVLDKNINLCKIVIPSFTGYINQKIYLDYSKIPLKIKNIIKNKIILKGLYTVDKPLLNKEKAEKIFLNDYSFVDMETYFIKVKFPDIPIIPILAGTDRGHSNAKLTFLSNLKFASKLLKDEISVIINEL